MLDVGRESGPLPLMPDGAKSNSAMRAQGSGLVASPRSSSGYRRRCSCSCLDLDPKLEWPIESFIYTLPRPHKPIMTARLVLVIGDLFIPDRAPVSSP